MSEVLWLFSLFVGFGRRVNVFESRYVGLCEKLGVRFHWGRCGTLSPACSCFSACMSEVLRLFSLFWEFGRYVNAFESRLLGLCEKLGFDFVWCRCGTFRDFSLHE